MRGVGIRPGSGWLALLAPIAGLAAIVGVVVVAVFSLAAMALSLLWPGSRRNVRVFRFGGPAKGSAPDPEARTDGASGNPGDADKDQARVARQKPRSHAEVVDLWPLALAATLLAPAAAHAKLLVPMDDSQANHLKAYGLTFWVLQRGEKCEWLLNYRGGSFLLPEDAAVAREANIRGVTTHPLSGSE